MANRLRVKLSVRRAVSLAKPFRAGLSPKPVWPCRRNAAGDAIDARARVRPGKVGGLRSCRRSWLRHQSAEKARPPSAHAADESAPSARHGGFAFDGDSLIVVALFRAPIMASRDRRCDNFVVQNAVPDCVAAGGVATARRKMRRRVNAILLCASGLCRWPSCPPLRRAARAEIEKKSTPLFHRRARQRAAAPPAEA